MLDLMTTSPTTVDMPRLRGERPLSFAEIVHHSIANISCITQRRNGVMALANATVGSTMIVSPDEASVILTPGVNISSKRPRLEPPHLSTGTSEEEGELRTIMLSSATAVVDTDAERPIVIVPNLDTAESLVQRHERLNFAFTIPTKCKINSPLILDSLHASARIKYE